MVLQYSEHISDVDVHTFEFKVRAGCVVGGVQVCDRGCGGFLLVLGKLSDVLARLQH